MLKLTSIFLCLSLLFSCSPPSNEKYILVKKVRSETNDDFTVAETYIDMGNTRKQMILYFWDNGNIMTRAYFYDKSKEGIWQFYSPTGKLENTIEYRQNELIRLERYDTINNKIKND